MRWDGGELSVGMAGQLPAALMDRSMVGSAEQGQVGQIGRAAMEPVAQVVGLAPGQRAGAVGEDTAAVADGQGGALGGWTTRVARPTSSGWVGAPPSAGGNRATAARSRLSSPWVPLGFWAAGSLPVPGGRVGGGSVPGSRAGEAVSMSG